MKVTFIIMTVLYFLFLALAFKLGMWIFASDTSGPLPVIVGVILLLVMPFLTFVGTMKMMKWAKSEQHRKKS